MQKNGGGPRDVELHGATADELIENCKKHIMEVIQTGNQGHKEAVDKMMRMGKEYQEKFSEDLKDRFDSLPDA